MSGKHNDRRGVRVCVGAGTGLGEAYLVWDEHRQQHQAFPSEVGDGFVVVIVSRTDGR